MQDNRIWDKRDDEIKDLILEAITLIDNDVSLLSVIGSWQDSLSKEDVILILKGWIERVSTTNNKLHTQSHYQSDYTPVSPH